jgi:hypothetical protein
MPWRGIGAQRTPQLRQFSFSSSLCRAQLSLLRECGVQVMIFNKQSCVITLLLALSQAKENVICSHKHAD